MAVPSSFNDLMADTALRTQTYDLVLLDLGLPRRDGLAVLRDLRTRKERIPVLIATARDSIQQRIEGLDAGAAEQMGEGRKESEDPVCHFSICSQRQTDKAKQFVV